MEGTFSLSFTFSIQFSLDNKYTYQIYLFHEQGEGLLKKTFISSFNSSNQIDWFSGFLHFLWLFNEMPLRTLEFLQSCALVYMYFPSWNKIQTHALLIARDAVKLLWSVDFRQLKMSSITSCLKGGMTSGLFRLLSTQTNSLWSSERMFPNWSKCTFSPVTHTWESGCFLMVVTALKVSLWPSMLVSVWDYNINRRSDYITEKPATSIVRSLILGWNSNGLTARALSSSMTHSWSFSAMDSHTSL